MSCSVHKLSRKFLTSIAHQCNQSQQTNSQIKRCYAKLSVREKKLMEQRMKQQEKKQVVNSYMRKYFSSASAADTCSDQATHESNDHHSFHSKLSTQKYKYQNQVEKILQLELTRKRNAANPRSKNSPGRVNTLLLQRDIDEQLYHSYSRKYFQHGFDVFIAKLRKENQANHKTKQVFCLDNQNITQNLEERISALVAEKKEKEQPRERVLDPLEEKETNKLIEQITSNSQHNNVQFLNHEQEKDSDIHMSSQRTEQDEQRQSLSADDEETLSYLTSLEAEQSESRQSTLPYDEEEDYSTSNFEHDNILQHHDWFRTDDIEDEFEYLEYGYDESPGRQVYMGM